MTITLEQIRSNSPCKDGWKKLNAAIKPGTTEVSIGDIALSNDAQDALWCTRCLPISERKNVVRCILPAVKRANKNTTNKAVLDCIDAIERWLAGDDSIDLKAFAADAAADAAAVAAAYAAAAADAAAAAAAAYAADAAADAADADAAAYAARAAAYAAADAAYAAERKQQIQDILAIYPATGAVK